MGGDGAPEDGVGGDGGVPGIVRMGTLRRGVAWVGMQCWRMAWVGVGVPGWRVPEDGAGEDGVLEDGVGEDGVGEDGVPEDGVAGDGGVSGWRAGGWCVPAVGVPRGVAL